VLPGTPQDISVATPGGEEEAAGWDPEHVLEMGRKLAGERGKAGTFTQEELVLCECSVRCRHGLHGGVGTSGNTAANFVTSARVPACHNRALVVD
jgi:hypothetical protein